MSLASLSNRRLCVLSGICLSCLPALALADQAILIGINGYPKIDQQYRLNGCLNDVKLMQETLRRFKITQHKLLTEQLATKKGILQAFRSVEKSSQPDERLVIYFAGHGREAPASGLATYNSTAEPSSEDIKFPELKEEIKALEKKGYSVTLVLDSCFSGMAMKSATRGRSRYLPSLTSKDGGIGFGAEFLPLKVEADNIPRTLGSCIVSATTQLQPANEVSLSGTDVEEDTIRAIGHSNVSGGSELAFGAFTYSLYKIARQSASANLSWKTFLTRVNKSMMEDLGDSSVQLARVQTALVSPKFATARVFGGSQPGTVEVDPELVSLFKTADVHASDSLKLNVKNPYSGEVRPAVYIGEPVELVANGLEPGNYPLLIEFNGVDFKRMFPDAELEQNQKESFEFECRGSYWSFDSAIDEELLLILCRDKDFATTVVKAVPFAGEDDLPPLLPKDPRRSTNVPPMVSCRTLLRVTEGLYEGGHILDQKAAVERILKGDAFSAIRSKSSPDYLKKAVEEKGAILNELYFYLNQTCHLTEFGNRSANIQLILDASKIPSEVVLRETTKNGIAKFKELSNGKRILVNRMIFEDLLTNKLVEFGPVPEF